MTIIYSLLVLGITGLISSVLLFFIAKQFAVEEDPRIDLVQNVLPGANCGGCGFAGCRNFAESCVKQPDLKGLSCPVGGDDVMAKVAAIVQTAQQEESAVAPQADGAAVPAFSPQRADALGAPNALQSDPARAAIIKNLPTPKACFPYLLSLAH